MNEENGDNLPELPRKWVWTRLGDLADIKLGKMLSRKAFEPGLSQLPYLRNENVRWFRIDTSSIKTMGFKEAEVQKFQLEVGDLLVCEGGEPGRAAVVTESYTRFMYQKALHRVRPIDGVIDARFLQYFFKHFITSDAVIERRSETTIKHLPREKMVRVRVPFPSPAEQHRIVEKIEELLSDLDAGVAALERVQRNLKRYRASVLKAAVEGRLTEAWRAEHTGAEPASELVVRILKERRRRWEADQLAVYKAKGKKPPKDWREKYKEPSPPDTTGLPDLPNGWRWATLEQLAEIKGGITKGQQRRNGQFTRAVPYLRVANVQQGLLDLSEIKEIEATEKEIDALQLQREDILFTEGGDRDKLGRGWIWQDEVTECIHQNHIFRARTFLPEIESRFVSWCGNSYGRLWFQKAGKQTVNLASINLSILKRFPVPLAPPEEQIQIRDEVEDKLSTIDKLAAIIDVSLRRSGRLRQCILKRAFEGKLVPQDPNDEPASVLLDRIRANRAANGVRPPTRTMNRRRRSRSKSRG